MSKSCSTAFQPLSNGTCARQGVNFRLSPVSRPTSTCPHLTLPHTTSSMSERSVKHELHSLLYFYATALHLHRPVKGEHEQYMHELRMRLHEQTAKINELGDAETNDSNSRRLNIRSCVADIPENVASCIERVASSVGPFQSTRDQVVHSDATGSPSADLMHVEESDGPSPEESLLLRRLRALCFRARLRNAGRRILHREIVSGCPPQNSHNATATEQSQREDGWGDDDNHHSEDVWSEDDNRHKAGAAGARTRTVTKWRQRGEDENSHNAEAAGARTSRRE